MTIEIQGTEYDFEPYMTLTSPIMKRPAGYDEAQKELKNMILPAKADSNPISLTTAAAMLADFKADGLRKFREAYREEGKKGVEGKVFTVQLATNPPIAHQYRYDWEKDVLIEET